MSNNSSQLQADCKVNYKKEHILKNVVSKMNNEYLIKSKEIIQKKNYEMVPVVSDTQASSECTNNHNLYVCAKIDVQQTIPKIKIRAVVTSQEQKSNCKLNTKEKELSLNGFKKSNVKKRKMKKIKEIKKESTSPDSDDELEENNCKEAEEGLSDTINDIQLSKHKAKTKMEKTELKKLFPSLYNFQCSICEFVCKNWNSLRTHCKDSHQAAAQVTCECGKVLMTRTALVEHRSVHADNTVYRCDKCEKTFHRKSLLNLHVMSHVPKEEQPFVCCKCARRFHCEALLRNHERVHLPKEERLVFPCHLCHKKFSSKSAVSAHLKAIHLGERPFVCDQCGHCFTSKGILQEHLTIHSDDAPWNCSKCNKNFKTKYRLKMHMDTHRETPYQCPKCPVQLSTRRTLRMHLVVHRDTKAYQCSTCGKAFRRAKDLKNHNNLHTGRRPYTCPFCARTFANGSNCRSHKRRMHPEELQLYEASLLLKSDNTKNNTSTLQPEEKEIANIKEDKVEIDSSAPSVSVLADEKKSNFSFNFNQTLPSTSLLTFAAARNLSMMSMGGIDYANARQNLLSRNSFSPQLMAFPIDQHFFSHQDAEHTSTVPAFPGNPYIHHQPLLYNRASSNN